MFTVRNSHWLVLTTAVLFCSASCGAGSAQDYYVDATGSDANDGLSTSTPFRTVQRAADLAVPGSTVHIRGGTYREQVSLPRSGTTGAPIIFTAYNGEDVQMTTTERLTGWIQHSGSVYKTSWDSSVMGRDRMTVFVDGQWINEAHWSDKGTTADLLDRSTFATYEGGSRTNMVDSDLIGFPDDHWDGAFVWVQSHNWSIGAVRIADFDGSTGTIALDGRLGYVPQSGLEYLIFDSIHALDAPGEWYLDSDANMLYLWVPGDDDPDNHMVEVKHRCECFVLNGNDHIQFVGLDMLGGDLDMAESDHVLVQGAHIRVPDRQFGPETPYVAGGLVLSGDHNTIRDCEIEHSWGEAVTLSGEHNHVINNYLHDCGYLNRACVAMHKCGNGCLISHNTFDRVGRGAIWGTGYRFVIQHNDFSRTAMLTEDVGALAFGNTSYNNSIVHHNVFRNIHALHSTGIYVDNMGTDLLFHHNISYNIGGHGMQFNLPAAFLFVYNNTTYDSGYVASWSPTANVRASGTRTANNIFAGLAGRLRTGGAVAIGNYVSASSDEYVDAANGDFRLVAGSGAVDKGVEIPGITDGFSGAAPDAGALELGEPMFAFGHDFANPPDPVYEWQAVPFMNLVGNPGLEDPTLAPWVPVSGSPAKINGNSWNYRDDALGTAGTGALELNPGDGVRQVVSGLQTNTLYEFSIMGRLVYDIEVEDYDAKSGTFVSGNYRAEGCLGDLDAGEWLCFSNVNFGVGTSLFDKVEIGQQWDTLIDVELRLGSPTGTLLATLSLPGADNHWSMARDDIPSITGSHDLYLVFMGAAGPEAIVDKVRLLNTRGLEAIRFTAGGFDAGSSNVTGVCTNAYWGADPDKIRFRTGASNTSVTLWIEKTGGDLNGYVDQIVLMEVETEPVIVAPPIGED